ncbi:hypothetical protein LTR94_031927, partial [Friedmanniomyces endolithicus]
AAASWWPMPIASATGSNRNACAPVIRPIARFQSCADMPPNRPSQRLLPTAKALQEIRAPTAQTKPMIRGPSDAVPGTAIACQPMH